jgi:hypothetical protein
MAEISVIAVNYIRYFSFLGCKLERSILNATLLITVSRSRIRLNDEPLSLSDRFVVIEDDARKIVQIKR